MVTTIYRHGRFHGDTCKQSSQVCTERETPVCLLTCLYIDQLRYFRHDFKGFSNMTRGNGRSEMNCVSLFQSQTRVYYCGERLL